MSTQTINLLRWHAGLEKNGPNDRASLASLTWKPADHKDSIDRAASDVLTLISELNHDLNGIKPSEGRDKEPAISRQIVFAVEEIRRMLKEAARKSIAVDREALLRSEAKIAWAWNAVVAGDIDDIRSYVDEQS
jgi:hypothetical protein